MHNFKVIRSFRKMIVLFEIAKVFFMTQKETFKVKNISDFEYVGAMLISIQIF